MLNATKQNPMVTSKPPLDTVVTEQVRRYDEIKLNSQKEKLIQLSESSSSDQTPLKNIVIEQPGSNLVDPSLMEKLKNHNDNNNLPSADALRAETRKITQVLDGLKAPKPDIVAADPQPIQLWDEKNDPLLNEIKTAMNLHPGPTADIILQWFDANERNRLSANTETAHLESLKEWAKNAVNGVQQNFSAEQIINQFRLVDTGTRWQRILNFFSRTSQQKSAQTLGALLQTKVEKLQPIVLAERINTMTGVVRALSQSRKNMHNHAETARYTMEKSIVELKRQLNADNERFNAQSREIEDLKTNKQTQSREINDLKTREQTQTREIEELKTNKNTQSREIDELKTNELAMVTSMNTLQTQLATLLAEKNKLAEKITGQEFILKKLTDDLRNSQLTLTRERSNYQTELQTANTKINQLTETVEKMLVHEKTSNEHFQKMTDAITESAHAICDLQEKTKLLEQQSVLDKKQIQQLTVDLHGLQSTNQQLTNENAGLKKEVDELKKQLAERPPLLLVEDQKIIQALASSSPPSVQRELETEDTLVVVPSSNEVAAAVNTAEAKSNTKETKGFFSSMF